MIIMNCVTYGQKQYFAHFPKTFENVPLVNLIKREILLNLNMYKKQFVAKKSISSGEWFKELHKNKYIRAVIKSTGDNET